MIQQYGILFTIHSLLIFNFLQKLIQLMRILVER